MTSERFWLITEPARGLSIKVLVPDNMLPAEALEHFAARDGYTIGEAYIRWRRESDMTLLEHFLSDETDDELTFHEVTRVAEIAADAKSPGELFETWKATKRRSEDLGRDPELSDATLQDIPGFIYSPGYISDGPHDGEGPPGRYHLLIEREEWWSDDYDELEARLFFLWAISEGAAP